MLHLIRVLASHTLYSEKTRRPVSSVPLDIESTSSLLLILPELFVTGRLLIFPDGLYYDDVRM